MAVNYERVQLTGAAPTTDDINRLQTNIAVAFSAAASSDSVSPKPTTLSAAATGLIAQLAASWTIVDTSLGKATLTLPSPNVVATYTVTHIRGSRDCVVLRVDATPAKPIVGAAGSSVTIAAGVTRSFRSDGSDWYAV